MRLFLAHDQDEVPEIFHKLEKAGDWPLEGFCFRSVSYLLAWLLFIRYTEAHHGDVSGSRRLKLWANQVGRRANVLRHCCRMLQLRGFSDHDSQVALNEDVLSKIHDHAFIDGLLQMPPEEAAVHTAVHVVRRTAASFPALVKAWWSDELSRAQTASVSKYFAKFVTPYVMSTNMELIREAVASQKWVNDDADVDDIRGKAVFDVKASAVGRTITCIYNVEEDGVSIEMLIRFPVDFPLKSFKFSAVNMQE